MKANAQEYDVSVTPQSILVTNKHTAFVLYEAGSDERTVAVIGVIRQLVAEREPLRAQLADWQNLFAAVVGQSLPGAPTLWPFNGGQDPAMVAFAFHQLRADYDALLKAVTAYLLEMRDTSSHFQDTDEVAERLESILAKKPFADALQQTYSGITAGAEKPAQIIDFGAAGPTRTGDLLITNQSGPFENPEQNQQDTLEKPVPEPVQTRSMDSKGCEGVTAGAAELARLQMLAGHVVREPGITPSRALVVQYEQLGELAMLVRRLAHALQKEAPGISLPKAALDYLSQVGLQGSPMRTAPHETPEDLSPNARWLSMAHTLCTDAGVPQGHIEERLERLRALIIAPAQPKGPAEYIEVRAEVRYWEDSVVNGDADESGSLMPFRDGLLWCPVIRLSDGLVIDWPQGTTAEVHYKVCDQGEYWLQNSARQRIAKWGGYYVPNDFLCHGDEGYGDYIIFNVDSEGFIKKWRAPTVVMAASADDDESHSKWAALSKDAP